MKVKMTVIVLAVVVIPWTASVQFAYDRGYRHGGDAEKACWTLEPAPTAAWLHGQITARRDTAKHPFLKGRIDIRENRSVRSVNSIPVAFSHDLK